MEIISWKKAYISYTCHIQGRNLFEQRITHIDREKKRVETFEKRERETGFDGRRMLFFFSVVGSPLSLSLFFHCVKYEGDAEKRKWPGERARAGNKNTQHENHVRKEKRPKGAGMEKVKS